MDSLLKRKMLATALAVSLLAACGGAGNGGVSSATPAFPASRLPVDPAASGANLSGQYKGTFTDGIYGKGKAIANYSQYQGALGGVISVTYANSTTTMVVAFAPSAETFNGNLIALQGSAYCTLSAQSTYNSKKHTLSGTYTAVQGCASDKGSFTLKQQCYYKGTGSDVWRDAGPKGC